MTLSLLSFFEQKKARPHLDLARKDKEGLSEETSLGYVSEHEEGN